MPIMQCASAEVRINAWLRKGVLVNRALVGKNSRSAVRIVRRTKLRIGDARRTAGDTVAALGPGPSHRVAYRDVDCVRDEHIATLPHRHIDNLTSTRWHAAHGRVGRFDPQSGSRDGGPFLLRRRDAFVARFSLRQKYNRKHRCQ